MDAIRLDEVTKTYGAHTAVDDLTLRVPSGSVYGFIGPNGSGKTTTIRMILHILHPDRGDVEVLGERRRGRAARAAHPSGDERAEYRDATAHGGPGGE